MRTKRSALLGLVLGLAVFGAACEDKTEVTIPPEPDPPIVVTVTPQQLTLEVGQSATLAAAVTGGAAGADKSVTWSSSNSGVASVDASGNVTAVAAGVATITATSVADAAAKAAAAVTVTAPPPPAVPSVSIKSITQFATTIPVALDNVFGQIDITLNVDIPTGAQVTSVETYIKNQVSGSEVKVCEQTFAAPELGATEEVEEASEIICSANTAAWTTDPDDIGVADHATITFPNGPGYAIVVKLFDPTGGISAEIKSANMIFKNPDFIVVELVGPTNCKIGATLANASYWCNGDIVGDFLPVIFSPGAGEQVNSITMAATDITNGNGATATDDASPWSITLQESGGSSSSRTHDFEGVTQIVVSSTRENGQNGPLCINPDPILNPINFCAPNRWVEGTRGLPSTAFLVDNVAPDMNVFDFRPVAQGGPLTCGNSVACYIGDGFEFKLGGKVILGYPVRDFDPVVIGAFDNGVSAGPANTGSNIKATFYAGVDKSNMVEVTTVQDLAETATADPDGYFLSVDLEDDLGNSATHWARNDRGDGSTSSTTSALQRVGIDYTIPILSVATGSLPDGTASYGGWLNGYLTGAWLFNFVDLSVAPAGPSGLPQPAVWHIVKQYTPAGTTCYHDPADGLDPDCDWPSNPYGNILRYLKGDGNYTIMPSEGYHEVLVWLADLAWNTSSLVPTSGHPTPTFAHMALQDVTRPISSGVTHPVPLTNFGGLPVTLSASVSDNLDLARADGLVLFSGMPVTLGSPHIWNDGAPIGEYGPAAFTQSGTATATIPMWIHSIQDGFNGSIYPATQGWLITQDFAKNWVSGLTQPFIPPPIPGNTGNAQMTSFEVSTGVSPNPSTNAICIDGTCAGSSKQSITLTVESSGILGTGGQVYNNPFLADFGVYVRDPVDPAINTGLNPLRRINAAINITASDAGTVRTWTWQVTVQGSELNKLFACPTSGTTYPGEEIYVIGVSRDDPATTTVNEGGFAMRLGTNTPVLNTLVDFNCN